MSVIGQTVIVNSNIHYINGKAVGTYEQTFDDFVNRVSEEANIQFKDRVINITYPNENTAVIVWRQDDE